MNIKDFLYSVIIIQSIINIISCLLLLGLIYKVDFSENITRKDLIEFENHFKEDVSSYSQNNNIPSKYSSKELGYITSIKNQGKLKTCWAFSTIAAIEASLIKNNNCNKDIDLSEASLAFFTYYRPEQIKKQTNDNYVYVKDFFLNIMEEILLL